MPEPNEPRAKPDKPCPICATSVAGSAETYPFCSERCRLVDLGKWLDEKYRIARPQPDDAAQE